MPDAPARPARRPRPAAAPLLAALLLAAAPACGDDGEGASDPPAAAAEGTRAAFDLAGPPATPAAFYDLPWPSDLRLDADGTLALAAFPNPKTVDLVESLRGVAEELPGYPTVPVAWFRFDAPLPPRDPGDLVPADPSAPLLLVDVDAASPDRGALVPLVAQTVPPDPFVPEHLLAVAPRPGFVLAPARRYAFVVRRGLGDAAGAPLGVPPALADLANGLAPDAPLGAAARALYAPLWPVLRDLGVPRADVAAATVFTTADAPAALYALTETLRARYAPTVDGLALDPDDGAAHPRFCELHGAATLPQLQQGEPPFDTGGLVVTGPDGLPVEQRQETVPVTLTLPRAPMPPGGYPLMVYFHGSGGLSTQVVDRGAVAEPGGPQAKGEGPAHVVAAHGFAAFGAAQPVNPERVPGGQSLDYINLANLAAYRDTFRQGVLEQRLLLDALGRLVIPPEVLAGCEGPTLPPGEEGFRVVTDPVVALGQSQGGVYAMLMGGVEPRIGAVAPTGTGGLSSHYILITPAWNAAPLIAIVLDTAEPPTFLHPAMHLLQAGWEPAEALVYAPRLARRPLPGHPVRDVYQPAGLGDSLYPPELYDAVALALGHRQAGEAAWPSMQEALGLAGLDGLVGYPVRDDLRSERGGEPYTGVVVQYEGDGLDDPHSIVSQLDDVKHQYGCFFETFWRDGAATVPAPAPLGTPCPP